MAKLKRKSRVRCSAWLGHQFLRGDVEWDESGTRVKEWAVEPPGANSVPLAAPVLPPALPLPGRRKNTVNPPQIRKRARRSPDGGATGHKPVN